MYIKENFIYLKQIKNKTDYQIAKNTNISLKTLYQIVNRKTSEHFSIKTVVTLAKFFEVTLDEFVLSDLSSKE